MLLLASTNCKASTTSPLFSPFKISALKFMFFSPYSSSDFDIISFTSDKNNLEDSSSSKNFSPFKDHFIGYKNV